MLIEVTAEDIEHGTSSDCVLCPIALALNRKMDELWMVGCFSAWKKKNVKEGHILPDAARAFVKAFDLGKPVEPFSFELPIS